MKRGRKDGRKGKGSRTSPKINIVSMFLGISEIVARLITWALLWLWCPTITTACPRYKFIFADLMHVSKGYFLLERISKSHFLLQEESKDSRQGNYIKFHAINPTPIRKKLKFEIMRGRIHNRQYVLT